MPAADDGTGVTALADLAGLAGLTWRKASFSNPSGNCVELARLADGRIAVRHSRRPGGQVLVYERTEMEAFLLGAKAAEFDGMLA